MNENDTYLNLCILTTDVTNYQSWKLHDAAVIITGLGVLSKSFPETIFQYKEF